MKRSLPCFIIAFLILMLSINALARNTITPFGRPETVGFDNYKGRIYTYYCLAKGQSMGFAVEGPARVDIKSRAGLKSENIRAEYQVQVWEGEYLTSAEKFRSKIIDADLNDTDLLPAASRDFGFDVPSGIHNYRLWLVSENIDTVFIRIYRSGLSDNNQPEANMNLLGYKRQVHLYSKKNQTPYYLIDRNEGARIKVTGPVNLIVRCRANFTTAMDGRIGYTISVLEDGKEVKTLSATTSKSLTMAYQDYTGVVPSKPTEFIFEAPEGVHVYDFILKESAAETVSLRFSMPKQD